MKKILLVCAMALSMIGQSQTKFVNFPRTGAGAVKDSGLTLNDVFKDSIPSKATNCAYWIDVKKYMDNPFVAIAVTGQLAIWGTNDSLKAQPIHWADTNSINVQFKDPTSGSTVVSNGRRQMVIGHAGTLAALTIQFPSGPVNGQIFDLSIDDVVTTLTLSAPGMTIKGTITTSSSGAGSSWIFYNAVWHKRTP